MATVFLPELKYYHRIYMTILLLATMYISYLFPYYTLAGIDRQPKPQLDFN